MNTFTAGYLAKKESFNDETVGYYEKIKWLHEPNSKGSGY